MANNKDSDPKESLPLHEQVYRHLNNALVQGIFDPGQRLTLRSLAEELGTSIAPVREAVSRLTALKALQVFPKRHIEVPSLTAETYMEFIEIRKLLEGHAAARACRRVSEEDIRQIVSINSKLLDYAKKGQLRKSMQENQRFHFVVYGFAGSPVLLESIEHLWLRVGPTVNRLLVREMEHNEQSLQAVFSSHDELIAALAAHDATAAMNAVTRDIGIAGDHLLNHLRRRAETSAVTLEILHSESPSG